MIRRLAHVTGTEVASALSGRAALLVVVVALGCAALAIEHTYVKHGRISARLAAKPVAIVAAIALASLVAPLPGAAQQRAQGSGLPDLISDPPFIWFNKDVTLPNGEVTRVMAFDGYLHNIGTGPLDVRGNPQIPGDVKQRVFDGENWEVVGTPEVQFETNDGHNHFHFMDAARYQLWNEARTEVIGDSSKVGFCLIDTEQLDDQFESDYDISVNNYCQVDTPDATELFMGITPGWRDTYQANVTFQWVDTSDVLPGRYWVSAAVDPLNQIVESNEDNNDTVFSRNKFAVDGYNARSLEVQSADDPIVLKANAYGTTGRRAFVIEQGPANGSLDVPTGVDILGTTVRYVPDPGFSGTDSFVYFAHDITSPYPFTPHMIEVTVEVSEPGAEEAQESSPGESGTELALSSFERDLLTNQRVEFTIAAAENDDQGSPVFFASGLPPGLTLSPEGVVSGLPAFAGSYETNVVAVIDGTETSTAVSFTVEENESLSLEGVNDFWTSQTTRVLKRLGTGAPGASYEGSGMPAGVEVNSAVPELGGTPEEIGTFVIEVRELIDGAVVNTIELTWTVTPSTRPAFAL